MITPAMAAAPVVLFQNIPSMNMANTPGLINPVYFWIKVKTPCLQETNNGGDQSIQKLLNY